MTLGAFRRFQSDDYLMIVALGFYTSLIVTINIVRFTSSNLLRPGFDVNTLSKQDIHERQYGSKLILVVEQCQCVTIWGAKLCLVILYMRLTTLRNENIAIKVLFCYVIGSFIVMDILYFGVWCQPFHNYWAVPTPNPQCDAATHHLITNAVFNLTSDCAMLAIGLPMFLRMHLPWQKKIPLILVFSLGIFTILAAILNKVYSFTDPFGSLWTYWYTRESSTALLVANLPFVWTFWRRIAGIKTVNGHTQRDTQLPKDVLSQSDNATVTTGNEKLASPDLSLADWLGRGSGDDVEMAGPRGRSVSFAEMLQESNVNASNEKEPTPITHPSLFYSRPKPMAPLVDTERAILAETPKRETYRRDSSGDERASNTPGSSGFPSIASKKSAGSFV